MLEKVSQYIQNNKLIEDGDRILVAVSGGADSVCLLHILSNMYKDTDVSIIAVHIHHGIRDKEADKDEAFVKLLCTKLGVEFIAYHYNVKSIAKNLGLSEEEAGRKVRYESFIDASKKYQCNKVAIAHNKNDNAETVLFNLFRGSGVKGLTGMNSMLTMRTNTGNITIIRPLLFITREEIETYLCSQKLSYQSDSTNFTNLYTRNKIRNVVLSYVKEEINTNVVEHITNAAQILDETYNYIEKCVQEKYQAIVKERKNTYEYKVDDLISEDIVIQKGIVLKILGKLAGRLKDIEAKHIDQVLSLGDKQVGRQIHLPYGIIALKMYDEVKLSLSSNSYEEERLKAFQPVQIKIPGRTYIEERDIYIEVEIFDYKKNEPFPKNSCMKWFDYDKIENTLKLRTRDIGDYLQINSQGGRKKLKDYFIDLKIPKEDRDKQLLVADGSHILWIIGNGDRISEKYKISEKTKQILSMKLINSKEKKYDR